MRGSVVCVPIVMFSGSKRNVFRIKIELKDHKLPELEPATLPRFLNCIWKVDETTLGATVKQEGALYGTDTQYPSLTACIRLYRVLFTKCTHPYNMIWLIAPEKYYIRFLKHTRNEAAVFTSIIFEPNSCRSSSYRFL